MGIGRYKRRQDMQHLMNTFQEKYANEPEFLQAVASFMEGVEPLLSQEPQLQNSAFFEYVTSPERVIIFRVPWRDDHDQIQINTGYRVQFSSVNGPYKGGLRFHPSVSLSVLKFLAFEQVFKNILTGLPIGGAKGGADFDPKGKSDAEVERFCQSFMTELAKHIGPDLDVPAGDIGVGGREIGYLYGQYKRLMGPAPGVITGKPVSMGGSLGRTEATGYGLVYFLQEMLKFQDDSFEGKRVIISGSGNVAYYAALKVQELGGRVVAMSDSDAAIYSELGLNLDTVHDLKIAKRQRLRDYANEHGGTQVIAGSVWDADIEADIALPCATQNEITLEQAKRLVANGIVYVAEGANMPTTSQAVDFFQSSKVFFAPGKAANAGGVAVSAMEMSQNAQRLSWSFERVDQQLHEIMVDIFRQCVRASQKYSRGNQVDLVQGADIASFMKLYEKIQFQGMV